jgi:DNA mismatch repair ATPase MutS
VRLCVADRSYHVSFLCYQQELVGFLRLHLRNVRDLPRLIARFSGPKSTAADWRTFKKGLRAVLEICRRVEGRRDELPLFHELHLLDPLQLEDLHDQIERTLDIADEPTRRTTTATAVGEEAQEASILTHRNSKIIHVKSSISSDLDALRQRYSDLDDELDRFTEDERGGMEATGGFVDQVVEHAIIVYMPQLGFMLQLPRLDDLSEDDSLRQTTACDQLGFEFKFHTGEMRYYKTPTTMELDANPGDIQSAIADKERMIILEVQEQVLQHRDLLRELSRKMEELDWSVSRQREEECAECGVTILIRFLYVSPAATSPSLWPLSLTVSVVRR